MLNQEERNVITEALNILEAQLQAPDSYFTDPSDVKNFLVLELAELEHEVFVVLHLNNQHGLIEMETMFRGTIDGASVYPREVAKSVLYKNAAAVIFAHNHPSGVTEPSQADKRITARLQSTLELLDVRVLDHIIVGGTDTVSFAERGLL